MRTLFVIVANKGSDIFILNCKGQWVHRETSDAQWKAFLDQEQAAGSFPDCPPWATNMRVARHKFMET